MASTTFLQKAYLAYFGRPADASGLITFANVSEAQVIASFSASPESQEFFGSMPVLDQINTIYNNLFNRDAEPAGLLHWATKIQNGELTLAAAAMEILNNAQNSDVTAVANKVAASAAFTAAVNTTAEILGYAGAASIAPARAFLAAVSDDAATLTTALAGTDAAVTTVVAAGSGNVGQTFMLTAGFDELSGNLSGGVNDLYVGSVENAQFLNGNKTTYNPGDVIDGGTGDNTLRLFVSQGADADGVTVSNIQTLDLRVNAGDASYFSDTSRSELVMTDWDDSLEQINIRSNKSNISIVDQQSIANVSISDQSTVNGSASYEFNYAAGVVDGVADALNVTLDNVNGTGSAEVRIDGGIEQLDLTVADRAGTVARPNLYASDVNLIAEGVTVLTVDGGRAGQTFFLEANNVAQQAAFESTAFAGNMDLTSNKIATAAFGAGDDVANFSDFEVSEDVYISTASSADASYNMGEGDNTLDLHVAFAGEAMAGAGDDTITAHATVAGASIAAGNGANTVTIEGAHAGAVTAGSGADEVSVISTAAGAVVSLDLRGQALVADGAITLSVSFVVAEGVKTIEQEFTLVGANATAIRNNLIAQINESDFGDLFDVTAGTPTGVIKFTSDLRLPELAVTSTAGAMTVVSQFSSSIAAGAGDNTVAVAGEHSGVIETTSGNDTIGVDTTTLGSSISAGDGDNLVVVGELTADEDEGTVTIVGADNDGDIAAGAGNDDIVVGATGAHSTINAGNGDNRIVVGTVTLDTTTDEPTAFTGEDHTGSILAGSGDDQVWTANVTAAVISVGDGTNTVTVEGDVVDSDITFGNGDDNSLIISGDLTAAEPGTITFGNGDGNTLTVGDDIITESVVMGTGTGSTISVAGNVVETSITVAGESTTLNVEGYIDVGSSITLGNGANVMTTDSIYYSDVTMGSGADTLTLQDGTYTSTIEMGGGNDTLTVGANEETDYAIGWYENEDLVKTVVNMGAGDDSVMLKTSGDGLNNPDDGYVYTNGFVDGGEGADTLTFEAQGSAKLIIRDLTQVASIDLQKAEGEVYAVGDVVSVTFTRGEEEFTVSYTLVNADFLQGADSVAVNVALHLAAKLNADTDYGDHFADAEADAGVVTIESAIPHEDFVITSAQADVQVLQNSDTRITDFETLNLVALNTAEGDDLEINANFELINGTDSINLDSQLVRVATVEAEDTNGTYTSNESGGVAAFTLENLAGGEAIVVAGFESSATANQQVSHIDVENEAGDHVIGDKITVTIGETEVVYTVSAADLNSDTAEDDANNIALSLSLAITAAAEAAGMTVAVDDAQITLIGQPGEDVSVDVMHTRAGVENIAVITDQTSWDVTESLYTTIQAGDVLTVTVGEAEYSYTVTAADCERHDASTIIDAIVTHFGADVASSDWGSVNFAEDTTVSIERAVVNHPDKTTSHTEQYASDTDDSDTDVVINANLAANATDTVMDLTVQGHGDFDLDITGGEDSGYTGLNLKLGDAYNHVIDTGGDFNFISAIQKLNLEEAAIDFLPKAYDVVFNDGNLVRIILSELNYFAEEVLVSTDGGETFDEFIGVDPTMDDFTEWAFSEYGMIYDEAFLTRIEKVTVYSDLPTEEGVESYVVESTSEGTGNFNDSITVSDVAGIDTSGSDITLDNVGAHTVTSTSKANLTIDQYGVRAQVATLYNGLEDETIHVTTGTGDDHLSTLAPSALNDGSSINLGEGENRLSLGWGEDATINGDELESLADMAYSGHLHQLDILTDVVLNQESTTLAMPGGVDGVSKVTFTDFNVEPYAVSSLERMTLGEFIALNGQAAADEIIVGANGWAYNINQMDDALVHYGDMPFGGPDYIYDNNTPWYGSDISAIAIATLDDGPSEDATLSGPAFDLSNDPNIMNYLVSEIVVDGVTYNFLMGPNGENYSSDINRWATEVSDHDVSLTELLTILADLPADAFDTLNGEMVDYAELVIEGAATDFTIETGADFGQDQNDRVILEVLGVENLTMTAGDEINIQLNGAELKTVDLYAEDDVDFEMIGAEGENAEFENLTSIYLAADDEVDAVLSNVRSGASLTARADANDGGEGDTYVALSHVTLGDVHSTVGYYDNGNVNISGTSSDEVTVGNITLETTAENAGLMNWDSINELKIEDNSSVEMLLGDISISAADTGFFIGREGENTDLHLVGGDVHMSSVTGEDDFDGDNADMRIENNTDSDIRFDNVTLESGRDFSEIFIGNNNKTNVSLAADGLVSLVSCEGDSQLYVSNNVNDHQPVGSGPDADGQYQSFVIELGDLNLDAGDNADLEIYGNDDDTFFGDLTVQIGDVNMLAYEYASLLVGEDNWDGSDAWDANWSTTVTMGKVDVLAQWDVNVDLSNNYGTMYDLGNIYNEDNRYQQDNAIITMQDVTLTSDYDGVYVNIDFNELAVIEMGNVEVLSNGDDDAVEFSVDDNLSTYFLSGDISLIAAGENSNAYFSFYDNADRAEFAGENAIINRFKVDGDLTLEATDTAEVDIVGNYGGNGLVSQNIQISFKGDTSLTAGDEEATIDIDNNDYVDVDFEGDVTASSSYDYAGLYVYESDSSDVTIQGDITMTSTHYEAYVGLDNNYSSDIIFEGQTTLLGEDYVELNIGNNDCSYIELIDASTGDVAPLDAAPHFDVSLTSQDGATELNIYDNDDSTIRIGDVVMSAGDYADIDVTDNCDCSYVSIGNVDVTAENSVTFDVNDNDGWYYDWTDIEIAAQWDEDTEEMSRGTIVLEGGNVGTYEGDTGVNVDNNDCSDVELGNFDITATAGDVKMNLDTDYLNDISTGSIIIAAAEDVYFTATEDDYDSNLETGDITITAGTYAEDEDLIDVSSDVYFYAISLESSETADDASQIVSIEALSKGDGEGNVYVDITHANELDNLTVSGTNAEIYLDGDIGSGDFTLDLSGLTGTFDNGVYYDPLGEGRSNNRDQDGGTFVSTWDADFDGDVTVKIGAGDVIYNAQHSNFSGFGEDLEYDFYGENFNDDWDANEGWFSLGYGLDLDPVREEQTVSVWMGDGFDGYGEGDIEVFDMVVNVGSKTFIVTWDGWGEDENDFDVEWVGHRDYDVNGDFVPLTLDEMAWEIGASDAGIYVDEYWGGDYDYITGSLKFFGPTNGTEFEPADLITNVTARGYQWFFDADDGGYWESINYDETMVFYPSEGDAADDGLGNDASETFVFDGVDVGDVVIGGFRPNGFFEQAEVDRLDFSAFADINSAADLIISIDNNDGYFDDVIIDFVNEDYGVVRLVGVGEYFTDLNVNGISNSIIFG